MSGKTSRNKGQRGEPTQSQVKKLLEYNPDTGLFTCKIKRMRLDPGMIAGGKRKDGYVVIYLQGKQYYAHRLAWLYMTGKFPKEDLDHINMNPSDNRWINLREASRSQNNYNRKVQRNNKIGYKGVYKHRENQYKATAWINKKRTNIGSYRTPEEASEAYQNFVKDKHKEFYNVG